MKRPVTKTLDVGSRQYLTAIADRLYNDALAYDRAGDEEMATAHLELARAVMIEMQS